tara:strand:- start:9229 stop:10176 length:948 start_codon:yes stop_codon:yes gene_type:complete
MTTKVSFERAPDAQNLLPHLKSSAARGLPMVEKNCHEGERALIISTGSTIKNKTVMRQVKHLAKDRVVFALKEAISFVKSKGIEVTYSAAMDPSGDRQVTRTPIHPDVIYCLASSCNPKLYDHIIEGGCEVRIFHSACGQAQPYYEKGILTDAGVGDETLHAVVEGEFQLKTFEDLEFCPLVPLIKNELEIYEELFGVGDCMTGGFTVTNRCLALAKYMGFEDIVMAGTDFGWRKKGGSHYSDIVKVATHDDQYMTDGCDVDGTEWFTKPDQLASAADVAKKIQEGGVTVLGDSLAAALSKKPAQYIDEVCRIET